MLGLLLTPILGIIALVMAARIRRTPGETTASRAAAGRARVLGIIGVITSIIVPLIAVGVIIGIVNAPSSDYSDFQPGQCFNRTADGSGGVTVHRVSCVDPHNAQATGRITFPDGPWPGPDGFQDQVSTTCDTDGERYLDGSPGPNVEAAFVYPTQDDWSDGERVVLCDIRTIDGTKITGRFPVGGDGAGVST